MKRAWDVDAPVQKRKASKDSEKARGSVINPNLISFLLDFLNRYHFLYPMENHF